MWSEKSTCFVCNETVYHSDCVFIENNGPHIYICRTCFNNIAPESFIKKLNTSKPAQSPAFAREQEIEELITMANKIHAEMMAKKK